MIYFIRVSFKLTKEPVRSLKRRKINISGITSLTRAVFTDTRQNVLLFVAVVSRFDNNLAAAS